MNEDGLVLSPSAKDAAVVWADSNADTQRPFATKKCESTYFLFTHLKRTIEINYLLLFF